MAAFQPPQLHGLLLSSVQTLGQPGHIAGRHAELQDGGDESPRSKDGCSFVAFPFQSASSGTFLLGL